MWPGQTCNLPDQPEVHVMIPLIATAGLIDHSLVPPLAAYALAL